MEGRWTIQPSASGSTVHHAFGLPRPDGPVPVVPCDDAAVDRVAYALACLANCGLPWTEIREQDRQGWRVRAEAVLRAAGSKRETP